MRDNERIIAAMDALSKQFKETAKELIEADASPSMICGVTNFWGELDCLTNSLDDNCSRDRGINLIHSPISEDLGLELINRFERLSENINSDFAALKEKIESGAFDLGLTKHFKSTRDHGIGLVHPPMSEDLGLEILKQLDALGTVVEQSEQAIREKLG